jgi:hypothetical protein
MNFLVWISANWQDVCKWAAGLYALFQAGKFLTMVGLNIKGFFDKVGRAEVTLDLLATNHFPHLQAEVAKVNENLTGLRTDILQILLQKLSESDGD